MDENFIRDFAAILREKLTVMSENPKKDDFEKGEAFAYYDVLDVLKSQLIAFGYDPKTVGIDLIPFDGDVES